MYYLTQLKLIFLTLMSLPVRRKVGPGGPRRAIIIQTAKLGDMVCTTPMFRAIKDKYPEIHLTVVGDKVNSELLAGHSCVDSYVVWSNFSALLSRVKEGSYDFGCVTSPNFEGLAILLQAGIPIISAPKIENGTSPYETRPYKLIRRFVTSIPHRMHYYAPREYLRLLEPIGIHTEDTSKSLSYSSQDKAGAEAFFTSHDLVPGKHFLVGMTPSAGHKVKTWPVERFADVANHLIDTYNARVIIFGSKDDKEECSKLLSGIMAQDKTFDASGAFSIGELKPAISFLNLFISADTGPIYIAEAFGVPTVDIVGPVDEREQPPQGKRHRVVVPQRDEPLLFVMNARSHDPALARAQAESVTAEEVMRETVNLISSLKDPL